MKYCTYTRQSGTAIFTPKRTALILRNRQRVASIISNATFDSFHALRQSTFTLAFLWDDSTPVRTSTWNKYHHTAASCKQQQKKRRRRHLFDNQHSIRLTLNTGREPVMYRWEAVSTNNILSGVSSQYRRYQSPDLTHDRVSLWIFIEFSSRFHSDSKRIRSGFESKRREFATFSRNSMASRIFVAFSQWFTARSVMGDVIIIANHDSKIKDSSLTAVYTYLWYPATDRACGIARYL